MKNVNPRRITYVPRQVRSKVPGQVGRAFVIWFVRVDNNAYQIGETGDLLAYGRDRRPDWLRNAGGDFIPQRRFRYWPLNLEN